MAFLNILQGPLKVAIEGHLGSNRILGFQKLWQMNGLQNKNSIEKSFGNFYSLNASSNKNKETEKNSPCKQLSNRNSPQISNILAVISNSHNSSGTSKSLFRDEFVIPPTLEKTLGYGIKSLKFEVSSDKTSLYNKNVGDIVQNAEYFTNHVQINNTASLKNSGRLFKNTLNNQIVRNFSQSSYKMAASKDSKDQGCEKVAFTCESEKSKNAKKSETKSLDTKKKDDYRKIDCFSLMKEQEALKKEKIETTPKENSCDCFPLSISDPKNNKYLRKQDIVKEKQPNLDLTKRNMKITRKTVEKQLKKEKSEECYQPKVDPKDVKCQKLEFKCEHLKRKKKEAKKGDIVKKEYRKIDCASITKSKNDGRRCYSTFNEKLVLGNCQNLNSSFRKNRYTTSTQGKETRNDANSEIIPEKLIKKKKLNLNVGNGGNQTPINESEAENHVLKFRNENLENGDLSYEDTNENQKKHENFYTLNAIKLEILNKNPTLENFVQNDLKITNENSDISANLPQSKCLKQQNSVSDVNTQNLPIVEQNISENVDDADFIDDGNWENSIQNPDLAMETPNVSEILTQSADDISISTPSSKSDFKNMKNIDSKNASSKKFETTSKVIRNEKKLNAPNNNSYNVDHVTIPKSTEKIENLKQSNNGTLVKCVKLKNYRDSSGDVNSKKSIQPDNTSDKKLKIVEELNLQMFENSPKNDKPNEKKLKAAKKRYRSRSKSKQGKNRAHKNLNTKNFDLVIKKYSTHAPSGTCNQMPASSKNVTGLVPVLNAETGKKMTDSKNYTLRITGPRQIELQKIEMPKMSDNDVLVKMHSVGICGSDVYMYEKGIICHDEKLENQITLGHEGSGIVDRVGTNVKHLKIGDPVAIEPGISCHKCSQCKYGLCNLCNQMKFNGLFASFCSHPAEFCHKLPKGIPLEQAAILHPLSLSIHASKLAKISPGSKVLILGTCPIGLTMIMAARAMGADQIIVVDSLEKHLQVARSLCADRCIQITHKMDANEIAERILSETNWQPNVVMDCCGSTETVNIAVNTLTPGGVNVIVGGHDEFVNYPLLPALTKELVVKTSFRACNTYPIAIEMVRKGRANLGKLITHQYDLTEGTTAFNVALNERNSKALKILVKC